MLSTESTSSLRFVPQTNKNINIFEIIAYLYMCRHVPALVYLWRSAGSFSQVIRLSSKYRFTCGAIVSPAR